ncbi:hypothetical protein RHMOL_Rhmol04G0283000 [Rhododendron molle]|uniref:Uncharacterized protein n=1 Tax=Rhododendron molle TaxID=49168 RepID=A0ACC0P5N9_RHOML|nr:hypothetical protein RHMOL_Rhmol04G0283000 [Rhododendron molle]
MEVNWTFPLIEYSSHQSQYVIINCTVSHVRFTLVLPFRRTNQLFCIFYSFTLPQSPFASVFLKLVLLCPQLFGRPQWHTFRWGSQNYIKKVREQLESRGCQLRSGCEVLSVSTDNGCLITCQDGSQETYDGCIVATNAPDTLKMLGKQATCDETRVLGAFQYVYSDIFLHRDKNFMPQNMAAWSGRNFLTTVDDKVCLTYWLNVLQNIRDTELPYLVTINPPHPPEHNLLKWSIGHPIPSIAASKASIELDHIQGKRGIWFAGAYRGYGFQEDGVKASLVAANSILTESCAILSIPKHMLPSFMETGARIFVIRFLGHFISTGSLILLEEGGSTITFEGTGKKCLLKTSLRVHSPQFYWKVAIRGELGLADAYIHGDFSLVDKNEGLQNLFMIFIANRDLKTSVSTERGWRTPLLFTACIGSAKYFFQLVSRQNTLTQARRNISRHYDLSNELFALFLDETLTYSCAIFEARINEEHEILEIGSGWGSLAIEVVKRTRCNYTGITLSEEQLRFAEMKVREAGLQDRIKFLLCHYRQLPDTCKYDRIISCEMIEHVGHEYMEEFFGCCDSLLADDGLLVLQFTSIPDERYDEYRRSSDFIKEYIFPGGCLPSLSRTTSAMAASSRLCEIISLGFDEKFMRTWVYYFDYCIAGFKTCTLGNYQMVFSRPGNVSVLGDPYKGSPSAYWSSSTRRSRNFSSTIHFLLPSEDESDVCKP